jgi:hypothetical protein
MSLVGELKPVSLFVQTGYLTIKNTTIINKIPHIAVKIPNFELKDEYCRILNDSLAKNLIKNKNDESERLFAAMLTKDEEKLSNIVSALYSGLPAEHHQEATLGEAARRESFYHSLLWAYCSGLVNHARAEERGAEGDPDLLLVLRDDTHVVIELKYAKDEGQKDVDQLLAKLALKALETIKTKRYGEKYKLEGKRLIAVGLGIFGRGRARAAFD